METKSLKKYEKHSKESGIYKATCTTNGKFYIGSCANFKKRIYQHEYSLNNGNHGNLKFQNNWNKYGAAAFVWEILEIMPNSTELERQLREQWYLDTLWCESILNIRKTTDKVTYRKSVGEEVREAQRQRAKTDPRVVATQFKPGHKALKGKENPLFGRPGANLGKPLSEGHKKKIGEANKKKTKEVWQRPGHTEKMSLAHKGQHSSIATEFKSGKEHPYYGKTSPMKGKKHSDEFKKNRSESLKKKIDNICLVAPNGEIYHEIHGIGEFAEKHGLNSYYLSLLIRGMKKSYKGWTCSKIAETSI